MFMRVNFFWGGIMILIIRWSIQAGIWPINTIHLSRSSLNFSYFLSIFV